MADPLSIAASVAGLISLGLQAASGITTYVDAVRGRKGDISSVETQVRHMQELLKLVENVAAKLEPSHSATAAFLKASASVEPEIKALEEGLPKAGSKKFTYPFYRPTMERLQTQLVRVNTMLQDAVQISTL